MPLLTYTHQTTSYNPRRYGKPWLGRLTGKMLTKDYEFLPWDGSQGSEGIFEFRAEPGQIIAHGQKDLRKGRGGIDGYYICYVDDDGVTNPRCLDLPCEGLSAMDLRSLSFPERIAKIKAARDERLEKEASAVSSS